MNLFKIVREALSFTSPEPPPAPFVIDLSAEITKLYSRDIATNERIAKLATKLTEPSVYYMSTIGTALNERLTAYATSTKEANNSLIELTDRNFAKLEREIASLQAEISATTARLDRTLRQLRSAGEGS